MSANSSNNPDKPEPKGAKKAPKKRQYSWKALLLFPLWVAAAYTAANLLMILGLTVFDFFSASDELPVNAAVFKTLVAGILYLLTLAIAIGVPYAVRKHPTTWTHLGLQRPPTWVDIGLAPLALIVYLLISAALAYIVLWLIPNFPHDTVQDVGFKALSRQYEYTLAFFTLVVVAPVAEETLFRGYLYGRLKRYVPLVPAVVVTSLLFAAAHLPGSDGIQWNVALDVFALSIILCLLRNLTGSIWAGILLHVLKNAIAFYLTFVGPMLLLGA